MTPTIPRYPTTLPSTQAARKLACLSLQQGRCGELVSSVWGKKGSGAVRLWDEKEEGSVDAPVMQM
jgi:hypothetical protein